MEESYAEFGIFIHWGIYAVPAFTPLRKTATAQTETLNGSEWYLDRITAPIRAHKQTTVAFHNEKYGDIWEDSAVASILRRDRYYGFLEDFEADADAGGWDPDTWMSLIKSTGATYMIITAKHHDGVSMYPSAYGKYHTSRDYIGEICASARKFGLKVGIYYSLMEWTQLYSKGAVKLGKLNYVDRVMIPQIKEIATRYHPDILWTDGDWQHTSDVWRSKEIIAWLFAQNPSIVLNDRWGKDKDELKDPRLWYTGADRATSSGGAARWEHVNTIGLSWGYATNQRPSDYKSTGDILKLRKQVMSAGGRFTLNIGPSPSGELDPTELRVMMALAKSPPPPPSRTPVSTPSVPAGRKMIPVPQSYITKSTELSDLKFPSTVNEKAVKTLLTSNLLTDIFMIIVAVSRKQKVVPIFTPISVGGLLDRDLSTPADSLLVQPKFKNIIVDKLKESGISTQLSTTYETIKTFSLSYC